jgi:hypothetical protein
VSEVKLSFKIDADGSPARRELTLVRSAVQKEVQTITQSFAGSVPVVGGLTSAFGSTALGIAAVGAATVGAVAGIFALAKSASEAGSRLNDLSIKTGLSVETLSGLDLQLKQSGASLETLATGFFNLQKQQAAARDGSKEAAAALARLGVDAKATAEDALRQFVKGLVAIKDEGARNAAGAAVMGRAYKDLSVFIADTGGDIEAVVAAAKKAGLVMSTEAARAADLFGDKLDEVSHSLSAMLRQMISPALPAFVGALNDITGASAGTVSGLNSIGQAIASIIDGGRIAAGVLSAIADNDIRRIPGMIEQVRIEQRARALGAPLEDVYGPGGTARGGARKPPVDYGDSGGGSTRKKGGGGGGAANKAANEAQALELRELALFNKEVQAVTQANREILEREYALNITSLEGYFKQANEENEGHYENQQRAFNREEEIARKYIKNAKELDIKLREIQLDRANAEDERNKEQRRLEDERKSERAAAELALNKQLADTQESIRAGILAREEAQAEAGIISQTQLERRRAALQEEAFNDQKVLLELELTQFGVTAGRKIEIGNALIKLDQDRANAADAASRKIIGAIQSEQSVGLPDPSGLKELRAKISRGPVVEDDPNKPDAVPDFAQHISIIGAFKDFAMDAFSGIAQGFGGMLQAFLLGGDLSGKAFLSMAKAVAAGLAAQALVEAAMQIAHAIKEKALAAASLAVGNVAGAALHTAAAAGHVVAAKAFGIVGGVAAAAALAIPGGGGGGGAGGFASERNDQRERTQYAPFNYNSGAQPSSAVAQDGSRNTGSIGGMVRDALTAIEQRSAERDRTLYATVDRLAGVLDKYEMASPGDVVQRGADTLGGGSAIAQATLRHSNSSHEYNRDLLNNLGFSR